MAKQDFLSLLDLPFTDLDYLIQRGMHLRRLHEAGEVYQPLVGKTGGLILQMNSTRTRVAFEAGFAQMGGHALFLGTKETQIGRGEPIADLARVLSEMVDIIMIRTAEQAAVEELARYASIPVINAMTRLLHPCQLLADIQTYEELRGSIRGAEVAFVGDGYNMCHSYINAARQWGFSLRIASPEGFLPDPDILAQAPQARLVGSPSEAVQGAHLVVTDVWSSMGHEDEEHDRRKTFADYQVNEALLDQADSEVLFMHCLPAHRGEEISATLLDDPRAVVFREAGNRLHSQKALIEFLLLGRC